jgi:NAD(P)-dependent dehydrogenase (short-subunit alcohol dehydrogenase family)
VLRKPALQDGWSDRVAARWKELLKNPMGQPQEIADLVAYLASPRASFISGTVITADAGRAARHAD